MSNNINSLAELHGQVTKLNQERLDTNSQNLINCLHIGEISGKLPSTIIQSTINRINSEEIGYTVTLGNDQLRDLIANDLNTRKQFNISKDNIIITNGSKQGLFYAIKMIIKPGDEVIVHRPYWNSYEKLVEMEGGKIITLPLEKNGNLNINTLRNSLTERTKMLIICSPHNPTGSIPEVENLKNVLTLLEGRTITIVSDEIYERIDFNNKHKSIASIANEVHSSCQVLTVGGFSKSHMMTGFRIGYLIANKEKINEAGILQANICTCACSLSQYVAIDALSDLHNNRNIERLNRSLEDRRDILLDIFKGYPSWRAEGAFYLFININTKLGRIMDICDGDGDNDNDENDLTICKRLLELGVAVAPGSFFQKPNYIRISYACSETMFKNSIPILKKFFS